MKRGGVWIDRAGAYVVAFTDEGVARATRLESDVAGRRKSTGGMGGVRGQVHGASHTKPDRRRIEQLRGFYEEVAAAVRDFDELAVIGPGLAKKEFEATVTKRDRHPRIVALSAADEMTDPQIEARFRELLAVKRRA